MQFCGELKNDAVWSGRVELTGDVVVPAGATLRLLPGSSLSFAAKPKWSCSVFRSAPQGYPIEATCRRACDIVVLGRFEASDSRLAAEGDAVWGGLTLLESGRARLSGCELSGCQESAVQCFDDGRLDVSDGEISRSRVGILGWGLSRVRADRVRFHDCQTAVLCREGSFARLAACDFERLSEGAWAQQWAHIEARGCRFEDCSNFRAGAFEQSRVSLDGRVVAGSEELR